MCSEWPIDFGRVEPLETHAHTRTHTHINTHARAPRESGRLCEV